jgi:hypothetical protein
MNTQTICRIIGDSGCYFLSLLRLYGYEMQAPSLFIDFTRLKWLDEDCYVRDPAAICNFLDNTKRHRVVYAAADYILQPDEREILRYERKTTGTTFSHFVVGNGQGRVEWDPLGDSLTVKNGSLVSKRIVRII